MVVSVAWEKRGKMQCNINAIKKESFLGVSRRGDCFGGWLSDSKSIVSELWSTRVVEMCKYEKWCQGRRRSGDIILGRRRRRWHCSAAMLVGWQWLMLAWWMFAPPQCYQRGCRLRGGAYIGAFPRYWEFVKCRHLKCNWAECENLDEFYTNSEFIRRRELSFREQIKRTYQELIKVDYNKDRFRLRLQLFSRKGD